MEGLEAGAVLGDEGMVDHRTALSLVLREDEFAEAHDRGNVTTGARLEILAADRRLLARQHLQRPLRIDEGGEALLSDRIEGHDLAAALDCLLQRMQKARAVRAGVLAEKEHRIALLEVFEHAGADRRAD